MKQILLISATLSFLCCSNFLDITPKDSQTGDQLYGTKGGFYIAVNGVYNGLASTTLYGRALSFEAIDLFAKRYAVTSASTSLIDLRNNAYTSVYVAPVISAIWQQAYTLIMACNILIENIENQLDLLTTLEADIMKGEMLAARAFLHLDMLRLFGPRWNDNPDELSIPYNELTEVMVLPLLPFGEVMTKILRDLNNAETLLANDPVVTDGPMASEAANGQSVQLRYRQFRFNLYAVKALKARAYLYAGDKVNALATAKSLLNDPVVQLHFPPVNPSQVLANPIDPDRIFSSEVLAAIYFKERDQIYSSYFSSETAGTQRFLQPRSNYVNQNLFAFGHGNQIPATPLPRTVELEDLRFQSQWEVASGAGITGYAFNKYKAIRQPQATAENPEPELFYSRMIPLLRLSEVYYIAAECETIPAERFKWWNAMRVRRVLQPIAPEDYDLCYEYFIPILTNEYLREFYGEGQVFYLYKRLGQDMVYDNGYTLNYFYYSENAYRLPLPEREMKSN